MRSRHARPFVGVFLPRRGCEVNARRWYAHAPFMVYAVNVYAATEREARAKFRAFLGVHRLPAGSAVWS
jgi:hypothetical protein